MELGVCSMNHRFQTLVATVAAIAAVIVSSWPWWRAFVTFDGGAPSWLAMSVAAILGVAVPVVVGQVLNRRLPVTLVVAVVAYLVGAMVFAVEPIFSLGSLADGFTSALARLLQSTPPLVVSSGTMVPAFTLVFATGVIMGELLVRTRAALGLIVPPVVGFGFAFAVTAQLEFGSGLDGGSVLWSLVALGVFGLLVTARRMSLDASTVSADAAAEREVALRSPFVAIGLLVVAGLLAMLVVNRLPGIAEDPVAVDSTPPVDEPAPDSPEQVMANYRRQKGLVSPPVDNQTLFRVTTDAESTGYFTVANLDSYDGGGWRFDRVYLPTGLEVPGVAGVSQDLVGQQYELVRELPFAQQWLPALDRPVVVPPIDVSDGGGERSVQAVYDPETGMVLSPVPLPAGTSYEVRSRVSSQTLGKVDSGTPVASATISPPGETASIYRDSANILGGWSAFVNKSVGETLVGDVSSLISLRNWMRANFSVTDDNFEVKVEALGGRPEQLVRTLSLLPMNEKLLNGDGQGTPEQLATMYVLLARQIGVPARLATGFRVVPENDRDQGLPAGSYDVTGSDAWTWAEVLIGDLGWVVVDPAPPVDQVVPPPTTTTIPEGSKKEEEIPNEDLTLILPNPVAEAPPPPEAQPPWVLIILVGLLALAFVAFMFVAGLGRRMRRRRRQRGDARQQVVGAWLETLDQLHEAELPGLRPMVASEVVGAASEVFGDEVGGTVQTVAGLSEPAVFSSTPIDEAMAAEAWRNLEATRKALKSKLTARQRFLGMARSIRAGDRWGT
jgi:hypothetical protein